MGSPALSKLLLSDLEAPKEPLRTWGPWDSCCHWGSDLHGHPDWEPSQQSSDKPHRLYMESSGVWVTLLLWRSRASAGVPFLSKKWYLQALCAGSQVAWDPYESLAAQRSAWSPASRQVGQGSVHHAHEGRVAPETQPHPHVTGPTQGWHFSVFYS